MFVIFIYHLDEKVGGLISKFAEGTKISGIADSEEGCQRTQQHDIDQMEILPEK